jgi:hypothetical protein
VVKLHVYQSIWAMEGLPWRAQRKWSRAEQVDRIAGAGFDGVSVSFTDPDWAREYCGLAIDRGLRIQASYFPTSVEAFRTVYATIDELGREHIDHINLQPNVRPRTVQECLPYLEGWRRIAEDAGIPVYVETHRDRMTTDLLFTLDLLDAMPDLELTADLSHFLVGREFAWPVGEAENEMIHAVLRRARAYHGRVASREQVQIQTSFPHHQQWVDLFAGWWEWGFRDFRENADAGALLTFTTELGPPRWYAITGPDGDELSDRWAEALAMKDLVRSIWARLEAESTAGAATAS